MKLANKMDKNENIVVTLSGRGDKDVDIILQYLKMKGKQREKYGKKLRKE
jgi:tryptophan synthase beta subunit